MHLHSPLGLFLAAALGAQTYVVDAAGGGNFTDLPQAIAAVPSGAVLRVRAGKYSTFVLAHKSLSILGDDPSNIVVVLQTADLVIGPTGPADRVLLHNLHCSVLQLGFANVRIADAAGQVVLDHVKIAAAATGLPFSDQRLQIERSRNVHLAQCALPALTTGGSGLGRVEVLDSCLALRDCEIAGNPCSAYQTFPANAGLGLTNSLAFCTGTRITGGSGAWATGCGLPTIGPSAGGPAVRLAGGSVLHAVACALTGGVGGSGIACRPAGAAGGHGADVSGSTLRVVGSTLAGGLGGTTGGAHGDPYRLQSGGIVDFASGPALQASLQGKPVAGLPVTCSLRGRAGDPAVLAFGYDQVFAPLPPLITTGAFLVVPVLVLGPYTVPASGVLDVPITLPLTWPVEQWIPFQFFSGPPALTELWAANSAAVLLR